MKWKIEKKYIGMAALALVVVLLSILFNSLLAESAKYKGFVTTLKRTFMPIIWGFILAYLLNPILKKFEDNIFMPLAKKIYGKSKKNNKERKQKRFARALSVISTMLLFLLAVVGSLYVVIPQVYDSIATILGNVPTYYADVEEWVMGFLAKDGEINESIQTTFDSLYEQLMNYVNTVILPNMDKIVKGITNGVMGLVRAVLNTAIAIIISVYALCEKENLISYAKKLTYSYLSKKNANKLIAGTRHVNVVFGGFINGKIADSIIIGLLCYIFMVIAGFEYSVLISLIVGVTNVIPYFGPFIGAIPSVLLLLVTDPRQGLIFAIFVLVLQQLDGNVIGPLILGESLQLSSMWILIAILVGGGLIGVPGMILGAPTLACIYSVLSKDSKRRLAEKDLPLETEDYLEMDLVHVEDNINDTEIKVPEKTE